MYDERSASVEAPLQGGMTPAVQWLITANVVVYFVQLTVFGDANVTSWLGLSGADFPAKWWAVVSYMFVHAGLVHLATNMLMLWMFGPRLERSFGTRAFVNFYLWCGLGGGIFHLLFVRDSLVVGASGAVVGVVLAYALRWPDDEVYLLGVVPMRARWLAVWTIAWNVGMALADMTGHGGGGTAWMAHVGGLAFAWLYLHAPMTASLDRIRQHVSMVPDLPEQANPIPKPRSRDRRQRHHEPPKTADEAVARSNALAKRRPGNQATSVRKKVLRPDDVNALLDKISRWGIESLTPDERTLLDDISRRLRNS